MKYILGFWTSFEFTDEYVVQILYSIRYYGYILLILYEVKLDVCLILSFECRAKDLAWRSLVVTFTRGLTRNLDISFFLPEITIQAVKYVLVFI